MMWGKMHMKQHIENKREPNEKKTSLKTMPAMKSTFFLIGSPVVCFQRCLEVRADVHHS